MQFIWDSDMDHFNGRRRIGRKGMWKEGKEMKGRIKGRGKEK